MDPNSQFPLTPASSVSCDTLFCVQQSSGGVNGAFVYDMLSQECLGSSLLWMELSQNDQTLGFGSMVDLKTSPSLSHGRSG